MNKKLIKCRFKLFLIVIPFIIFSCNNVKEEESLVLKSLKQTVLILQNNNNINIFNGRSNDKSAFSDKMVHKFLSSLDNLETIRNDFYKDINEININHNELYSLIQKYQLLLEGYDKKYLLDNLIGANFILSNSRNKNLDINDFDPYLLKYMLMVEMEVIFSIYFDMIASRI